MAYSFLLLMQSHNYLSALQLWDFFYTIHCQFPLRIIFIYEQMRNTALDFEVELEGKYD